MAQRQKRAHRIDLKLAQQGIFLHTGQRLLWPDAIQRQSTCGVNDHIQGSHGLASCGLLADGVHVQQVKALGGARNRLDMCAMRIRLKGLHKGMTNGARGTQHKGSVRLFKQGRQVVQPAEALGLTSG